MVCGNRLDAYADAKSIWTNLTDFDCLPRAYSDARCHLALQGFDMPELSADMKEDVFYDNFMNSHHAQKA